ncbi:transposase family protein [Scytonema sp. PCC 10023]|uniref:transposase family protein n=1 Tax=Scytonema sp. PCC 10023 TaxID=1680591 RepID=UPI0039C708A6
MQLLIEIKTPTKKPKKQELSLEQKEKNKELASERIFVEHIIRFVKIFRVASERFRLNPRKYEQSDRGNISSPVW